MPLPGNYIVEERDWLCPQEIEAGEFKAVGHDICNLLPNSWAVITISDIIQENERARVRKSVSLRKSYMPFITQL